jgi:hypothetical protein
LEASSQTTPPETARVVQARHGTALPLYLVSAAPLDFFSTTSPAAVRRARKRVRAHVSYRATSGPPMDSRASKSAAAGTGQHAGLALLADAVHRSTRSGDARRGDTIHQREGQLRTLSYTNVLFSSLRNQKSF